MVAAAIPCAVAVVLALAGVFTPGPGVDVRPAAIQHTPALLADAEEAGSPLAQDEARLLADAASEGRDTPVALDAVVSMPELGLATDVAALDPKTQKAVDKLLKKILMQESVIEAKQSQIGDYQSQLALAETALLLAQMMPEGTAAELKAKLKAIKKANAALLKWQKKIAKAEAKIESAQEKIEQYEEKVEEVAPEYFNDSTGEDPGEEDPNENEPPPDPNGNGDGGSSTPSGGNVTVPLFVQEALPVGATAFTRNDAIATFGIPFAATDQVGQVNGRPALAVQNSDTYQFRTLATWPSGHVKWALVDTAADVTAGTINTSLQIVNGQGRSGPNDMAYQDAATITVNTGPLVFKVSKAQFDVFNQVWVNNQLIVPKGQSVGIVGFAVQGGGLIMPKPGSTTVVIEENGPAKCVIRADGILQMLAGMEMLDFTCRMIARAGSRDVQVDFTVRNANIARPHHLVLDGLAIATKLVPGANQMATMSKHNGPMQMPLNPGEYAFLHQARSAAYVHNSVDTMLGQEGYQIVKNGFALHPLGDATKYPKHGYADLSNDTAGITVAYQQMPYKAPASLELFGSGHVVAGLFSWHKTPGKFWTYSWRQHESRTVSFSFHTGQAVNPSAVAAALDLPVVGRAADYLHYDRAGVLPYRLVSLSQQNQAFASMGLDYAVSKKNEHLLVTRWLYAHETGGNNNHDSIERQLGGEWLRQGFGGQYLTALDLALYKSEWQILRSDNFHHKNDPGAANPELPHTSGYEGDYEHRYRDGIILAYWLTGDQRFRDALHDEAEILSDLYFYPQERGTVQSLRAMARVGEFTGDPGGVLRAELKAWLQTYCSKLVDINVPDPHLIHWGWQAAPGTGSRRYYVTNVGSNVAPIGGNYYQSRGFFTASLAPLGMYHAARWLGTSDPQGALARTRLRDLAYFTREELYPYKPNPVNRWLVYTYGVNTKTAHENEETDFHPIWLGMGEAFKDTGDVQYMQRAIEAFEGFAAHDNGEYANNLHTVETRLDVQHFIRTYLDWQAQSGGN